MNTAATKPLGMKAYGSIPHIEGSRMGPADHKISPGQSRMCTEKLPDNSYRVIVQEKLDGSCCAVARINGALVALGRSGYPAQSSRFEQHQLFADWVRENWSRFGFLEEGQRVVGEWLAQAHGTRYSIEWDPFVAFDIMDGHERLPYSKFMGRTANSFEIPEAWPSGDPVPVDVAVEYFQKLNSKRALDPIEGVVYRVERTIKGVTKVQFLAKYVRPDKADGCYLPEISGKEAVWNWRPGR